MSEKLQIIWSFLLARIDHPQVSCSYRTSVTQRDSNGIFQLGQRCCNPEDDGRLNAPQNVKQLAIAKLKRLLAILSDLYPLFSVHNLGN